MVLSKSHYEKDLLVKTNKYIKKAELKDFVTISAYIIISNIYR